MSLRIIPRLDIKGSNLVKGIHLEGLRVLGTPEEFAHHYYCNGADELLYMDVVASLYQRNSLLEIIKKTASKIFIPLIVGGGLRTLDDIRNVLRSGADKVAINTAAIRQPQFVQDAVRRFGASTIVISIEAKKMANGSYQAYTDNGRERMHLDVFEWAKQVDEIGVGEILVTSIDQEGTGKGFDIELTRRISETVSVPVIACGGAGNVEHVKEVADAGKADAVAIASLVHYDFLAQHNNKASAEQIQPLGVRSSFSRVTSTSIPNIKRQLVVLGQSCRYSE